MVRCGNLGVQVKQWFPRQGTDMTPVHSSEDFT